MTTPNLQPGALAVPGHLGPDPFNSRPQDGQSKRYSAFDNSQFSLYLNGSPLQAKRALEAHLAETTRRLQETSHLGNALVQQRKELEDKLQEVDQQQQADDIGPELRLRLAELEKEFNEVGRETARAFLPRSRVASGETDITGSGSVYSSEAQQSPTKVSVPSRKQRNQQPSRINDIALATEISTSLLNQLKELQAVLLEREEALKAADLDRSQLEIEVEGLSQRLRTLDESDSRLKDVNWNLETQVREAEAQFKSAADKEHRLNHALDQARSEKSTLERELEEIKQLHARLNDEHINKSRQHETELSSLRRNITMGDMERSAIQRKVEELTVKNQELAKAVAYRVRGEDQEQVEDASPEDGGEEGNDVTPEHSPPVSPSKATPRHGMLESETLKHSLQHAHRMIQQLKNNIHREKTEKLELKRMLQDTRDELEKDRALNVPSSAGKRRKTDKDAFKKPARPDRLGALRTSTQEIVVDDEEWEEQGDVTTPSRRVKSFNPMPRAVPGGLHPGTDESTNEGFQTANDTSDAAFETANERDGMTTETDAFQTGAETLDGDSSDDLTETEGGSLSTLHNSRSLLLRKSQHDSYESTASNSGDEYDDRELRTPLQHHHSHLRLRSRQGSSLASTPRGGLDSFNRSPSLARDSPASLMTNSTRSTPAQGKSLFAELEDLSGDEDDGSYIEGTPSRSTILQSRESSPDASKKTIYQKSPLVFHPPRPMMVDSGTMTVPIVPAPISMSSVSSHYTTPQTPVSLKLQLSSCAAQETSPQTPAPSKLQLSLLASQGTEPQAVAPPAFQLSGVSGHATAPQPVLVPSLALSSLSAHGTVPQPAAVPQSEFSSLFTQHTAPCPPLSSMLDMSSISSHASQPRDVANSSLSVSALSTHGTEPVTPITKRLVPSLLDFSSITCQTTEPKEVNASTMATPAGILATAVATQAISRPTSSDARAMPVESRELSEDSVSTVGKSHSPQIKQQIPLQISDVATHTTDPKDIPRAVLALSSALSSQATEPSTVQPTVFRLSGMSYQTTEPSVPVRIVPQFSSLVSQATQPVSPQLPRLQFSALSSWSAEPLCAPGPAPPTLSGMQFQDSTPKEPSRPAPPSLSMMSSQTTMPVEPSRAALSQLSIASSQETVPCQPIQQGYPQVSAISVQHTEPVTVAIPMHPQQQFSRVRTVQDIHPESPTLPAFLPTPSSRPSTAQRIRAPLLALSPMVSQVVEPSLPSRPVTAHRAAPLSFGVLTSVQTDSRESLRSPISPSIMSDGGTQTMVSAEQIDRLLLARNPRWSGVITAAAVDKTMSPPGSPSRKNSNDAIRASRRPGSSGSMRSRAESPPPLPSDHKKLIAAAAQMLPPPTSGSMGPPPIPTSAHKTRPLTPSIKSNSLAPTPRSNGTTPRPNRLSHRSDARSGASSPVSRRSSVSSFASELEARFNIPGGPSFAEAGLPAGATDPRMIQAITQTMIGEYLWKYTRKAGRGGMSENRHRRFFWIHPYTRTLYWSEQDPQTAGKSELKAKSLAILSVQDVEDTNPLPPGLHQRSLLVTTPGRSIKFTAPTGKRHETWYNALNYLCERLDKNEGASQQQQQQQQRHHPKSIEEEEEIQDEFNGGYRSTSRMTGRSRASVSSYVTRRTVSPHHTDVPTLKGNAISPLRTESLEAPQNSVSSRFASMLRPSSAMRGSFANRHSRVSVQDSVRQEQVGSNLDLSRDIHEHVEREIDGMPNVRACCGGAHDVAHLHQSSVQGRHSKVVNPKPSLIGSMSSRISSRAESRNEPRSISRNEPRSTSRNEPRSTSRNESRTSSRTSSRLEAYAEARNDRIRHHIDMESANFGAGA